MAYAPEAGDLIWTGREQSGRRPALAVSPADFCRVTEFAIVCPITSRVRPFGTSVVLPPGLPVSGEILTSHLRSIDTLARPISYAGAASPLHSKICSREWRHASEHPRGQEPAFAARQGGAGE